MEIGCAVTAGTPIYAAEVPSDLTLRQYVHVVEDIQAAVKHARRGNRRPESDSLLLDPAGAIDAAQRNLESIRALLTGRAAPGHDVALAVRSGVDRLRSLTNSVR
jgi:hypothetical protein